MDPDTLSTYLHLAALIFLFVAPIILLAIARVRATRWGKAHQEALDVMTEAIGAVRKIQGDPAVHQILQLVKLRENTASAPAVAAWKASRRRMAPKPTDKEN